MKRLLIFVSLFLGLFASSVSADYDASCNEVLPAGRAFTRNCQAINSRIDFWNVVPAIAKNNLVNAVVAIPAGTNVQWRVDMTTGALAVVPAATATTDVSKPGVRNGHNKSVTPTVIQYLGAVGNYAIIPRTAIGNITPAPLEILVIGGPMLRSSVTPVKLIGAIQLTDQVLGEDTYKLIAILPGTALAASVNTLADLDLGVTTTGIKSIIQTWFENYKGHDASGTNLLTFVSFMEAGTPGDNFTNGTAFGILNDSNTE